MLDKYVAKNGRKTAYRTINGEAVVVNLKDSTFHTLNPVATFIWEQAQGQFTVEQIIERICQEFEVDRDTAERDCREFVDALVNKGLIVVSELPLEEN